MRSYTYSGVSDPRALEAHLERMEARIAELEVDAARYRYWRERNFYTRGVGDTPLSPENIDAMIDAAIAAREGPQSMDYGGVGMEP